MNPNLPENSHNQEIDLAQVSNKINNFFKRIKRRIFNSIHFFVKNWITILGLIVIGFGLGKYLETIQKSYENQIIVTPNFGSVDYLYSNIDLIESKIMTNDTLFLKNVVGIKNPEDISLIEIMPITDVYKLIENKPSNFELIKLMAEDGEVKKVIDDNLTSKNYVFHTITITTKKALKEDQVINPVLNFLNSSTFFNKVKATSVENFQTKLAKNDSIIKQIDIILANISNQNKYTSKSDKLIYYNENTQLNEIIKTKEGLISEQGNIKIQLLNIDKTIKDNSVTSNLQIKKAFYKNKSFLLPIFFIFIYVLVLSIIQFYKKNIK